MSRQAGSAATWAVASASEYFTTPPSQGTHCFVSNVEAASAEFIGKSFRRKTNKVGKAKVAALEKIIAEDYRTLKKQFVYVEKITK